MRLKVIFIFCIPCWLQMVDAQTTAIPDGNFEAYLENHDADGNEVEVGDPESMGDGILGNAQVETARLNTVISLDVSGLNIYSLEGIQAFTNLETLICSDNDLAVLDISNNLNLTSLLCGSNNLNVLDISSNSNLVSLNATDNQISQLNLNSNAVLESVSLSKNRLSNLNLSNNPELVLLSVSDNRLMGTLDLSANPSLESLFCASNQITSVDLSANQLLRQIDLSDNRISSLDLTNVNAVVCPDPQTDPITPCQGLSTINVSRNELISLVVNNGYNELVSLFNASGNPDLFCIQIDSEFTPEGWIKDDWTYFSASDCVDLFTYIPDANFEQQLIELNLDDTLDNLVLTSNISNLSSLNVANAGISSLEGLQDFLSLQILDCSANNLEIIDLANNSALMELYIGNNDLQELELTNNSNLSRLSCPNNSIEHLDLSSNTALQFLDCASNSLTELYVTNNQFLNELDASFNEIFQLDLTSNPNLTGIKMNNNRLLALNMANGNNTSITILNTLGNTDLSCIEVDDVAFAIAASGWQKETATSYSLNCGTYVPDDAFEQALIDQGIDSDGTLNNYVLTADVNGVLSLNLSGLMIQDLTGIEDFVALQTLNCSNNLLEFLNLEWNLNLQTLDCSFNQISNLNLSFNSNLSSIQCQNNTLNNLNVANGFNANITVFNAQNNPALACINVDGSVVNSIPGAWQKDDFASYNQNCLTNRVTIIPDPIFEQLLIDSGVDDFIDGQVLTAAVETIEVLEVSGEGISDLTGIQDFRLLRRLDCSSNFLESLDVSNMPFLEDLNCGANYFSGTDISNSTGLLNITGAVALKQLLCAGNYLQDLDTSDLSNLEVLNCADNNINLLNVASNTKLKRLNCSNNELASLDLSNTVILEQLNCDSNELSSLILINSPNSNLVILSCADNQLSTLDVSNSQGLTTLSCSTNSISQLDISSNTALERLSATNNQIEMLDVSNNTALIELLISQNNLTQLAINNNNALRHLNCSFNDLEVLDLASNGLLERLYTSNNRLSVLNLTNNDKLIDIDLSDNQLSNLTLASDLSFLKRLKASNNQIENALDLSSFALNACTFVFGAEGFCPESIAVNLSGNLLDFVNIQNGINDAVAEFDTSNNPYLECIQVDDESSINPNWIKDDTTSYAQECNFGQTFVPDDNFEQALIALGLDTGELDDFVPTANIDALLTIDLSNNAILDLTGIEDFLALESLNVSNNNLEVLDLSNNLNLINLNCSGNGLTALDLSTNSSLNTLDCSSNAIAVLQVTHNHQITDLNAANNAITLLELTDLTQLQSLNADFNSIINLDFSTNTALNSLSCQNNLLETLNLKNGQNAILTSVNAKSNPDLNCIETDTGTIPSGANWAFDDTAELATECFFGQTFVPDDNFEQALIDLGFDFGELDDYILTERIETVEVLILDNQEILDFTGIEDFVGLRVLSVANNLMTTIQLSNLTELIDLNLSNNALSELNLSAQGVLLQLNASNNLLTTIDLGSNPALVDLNLSNNLLTELQVGLLTELETLSCASNELTALEIINNTQLKQLFCQSNQLIADQLNLKNGNNQTLEVFNALNNPNLSCILVDDPVAVITNSDGFYDNWFKDETASYQSICADADNDGIANVEDQCPNTLFGAAVDLFGCAIPDLPVDNFSITVTSETCLNSNNGSVTIVAQELKNYTATLTKDNFNQSYNFTNDVDIFNLLAGTYELCITMEEWPSYQSCYTVVISQPDPLEVFSSVVASGEELSVHVTGASSYFVTFNNDDFMVDQSSLRLRLQPGLNQLTVKTNLECQEVFEATFWRSTDMAISPNPFKDQISLTNLSVDPVMELQMYSSLGTLVFTSTYSGNPNALTINTTALDPGVYLLVVRSANKTKTHKIVKQ